MQLSTLIKAVFMLSLALFLTACKPSKLTYSYLVKHPELLKEQEVQCEQQKTPECAEVTRASQDFYVLIREYSSDPEGFGQKILTAESNLAQQKQALKEAQQKAAANVPALEKSYQTQAEKIEAMLSIVALGGSPQ